MEPMLTDEEKQIIYNWIDEIPLTRPKKNISRDFSDAVLIAEVIKYFIPKLVDVHNYAVCSSVTQKITNWETLNKKVLKKLGCQLTKTEVQALVNCQPDAIEKALIMLKPKVESYKGPMTPIDDSKANKTPSKIEPIGKQIETEMLTEKEGTIQELKETIEIMEHKIKKLEQLIKLKDDKIQVLTNLLTQNKIANV